MANIAATTTTITPATSATLLTSAPVRPAIGFNGDPARKEFFVARAQAHQQADEIVKGEYWQNGKGCAVGCLIHGSSHAKLAEELGIPLALAYVVDRLFDRMPDAESKMFPPKFVQAIKVGSDTNAVWDKFVLALLSDPEMGAINFADESAKPAVRGVIDLCKRQVNADYPQRDEWLSIRRNVTWPAYAVAYGYADAYAYAYAAAVEHAAAVARNTRADHHFVWQAETLLRLLETAK